MARPKHTKQKDKDGDEGRASWQFTEMKQRADKADEEVAVAKEANAKTPSSQAL